MIDDILNKIKETKDIFDYKSQKIKLLNQKKKDLIKEIHDKTIKENIQLKNIELELKLLK